MVKITKPKIKADALIDQITLNFLKKHIKLNCSSIAFCYIHKQKAFQRAPDMLLYSCVPFWSTVSDN